MEHLTPEAVERKDLASAYRRAMAGRADDLDLLGDLPWLIAKWAEQRLGVLLSLTEARQAARRALSVPIRPKQDPSNA